MNSNVHLPVSYPLGRRPEHTEPSEAARRRLRHRCRRLASPNVTLVSKENLSSTKAAQLDVSIQIDQADLECVSVWSDTEKLHR